MFPATVLPITATCRFAQFHKVALSEAVLVSGSVDRITLSGPRCARPRVRTFLSVFASSSVVLSKLGSSFSDVSRARVWLLPITEGSPLSALSVLEHRAEHGVAKTARLRRAADSFEFVPAVHDTREHQLEVLIIVGRRRWHGLADTTN